MVLQGEETSCLGWYTPGVRRGTDSLANEVAGSVLGGERAKDSGVGTHVGQNECCDRARGLREEMMIRKRL